MQSSDALKPGTYNWEFAPVIRVCESCQLKVKCHVLHKCVQQNTIQQSDEKAIEEKKKHKKKTKNNSTTRLHNKSVDET